MKALGENFKLKEKRGDILADNGFAVLGEHPDLILKHAVTVFKRENKGDFVELYAEMERRH